MAKVLISRILTPNTITSCNKQQVIGNHQNTELKKHKKGYWFQFFFLRVVNNNNSNNYNNNSNNDNIYIFI